VPGPWPRVATVSAATQGCGPAIQDAVSKVRAGRNAVHLSGVLARFGGWRPMVRRMRLERSWGDIVRLLNRDTAGSWTAEPQALLELRGASRIEQET